MISLLTLPTRFVEDRSPRAPLPEELETIVEDIWQKQRVISRGLFNGQIFAVQDFGEDSVTTYLTEYRLFVAQWNRPDIFGQYNIDFLSVNGVLCTDEGIVWGRRNSKSTQWPGVWELIPSGGVDEKSRAGGGEIDPLRALYQELREEIGLDIEQLRRARPFCFLHDAIRHILILCIRLETVLSFAEIGRIHAALPEKEHSDLSLVPFSDLPAFLQSQQTELADFSRAVLSSGGWL